MFETSFFQDAPLDQINISACEPYVSPSGREYAITISSLTPRWVVTEVTRPHFPEIVAVEPIQDNPSLGLAAAEWIGPYLFVGNSNPGGIHVLDMTQIDQGVVTDSVWDSTFVVGAGGLDLHYNPASNCMYRGSVNGVQIFDMSQPLSPTFLRQIPTLISSAYVEARSYTTGPLAGRELLYCGVRLVSFTGLVIFDVTDKSAPFEVGRETYPGAIRPRYGVLSDDGQVCYLSDEALDVTLNQAATTFAFDVSQPASPSYVSSFADGPPSRSGPSKLVGDRLYQAQHGGGLVIWDLSAPFAPAVIARGGPASGNGSTADRGLGNINVMPGAATIIGVETSSSSEPKGLHVWRVGEPTVSIEAEFDPEGCVDAGAAAVRVRIDQEVAGTLVLGSEELYVDLGNGPVPTPLVSLGSGEYEARFPGNCGDAARWYVRAEDSNGIPVVYPDVDAFDLPRSIVCVARPTRLDDSFEVDSGWIVGDPSDTAKSGVWERVDPIGTTFQPEDDRTPSGSKCWVTGQGSLGGAVGENDVDFGATTLTSPVFDATGLETPGLDYWRWYRTNSVSQTYPDILFIDISNDGGSTWTELEAVARGGGEAQGGWFYASHRIEDFVTPTSQMRVRFTASDFEESPSLVEAAVDDFRVFDFACGAGVGTNYCDANENSTGIPGAVTSIGSSSVAATSLRLVAHRLPPGSVGYFLASTTQGFVPNPAGSSGNLCLGGSIGRFIQQLGAASSSGAIEIQIDPSAIPQPTSSVPAVAGESWSFQCWHRDSSGTGPTSNFTTGYAVIFR